MIHKESNQLGKLIKNVPQGSYPYNLYDVISTLLNYISLVDACGEMFPFGLDSSGSRSIIETLYNNHNYRTQITDTGKQ